MANEPNLAWIAGYIWGLADDVLRDVYVRGKYRDVILPMTVLRRLDAVLPAQQITLIVGNMQRTIAHLLACLLVTLAVCLAFLDCPAKAEATPAGTLHFPTVAPEYRCSPYRRDDYHYPASVENGITQVMGGAIYSPYTGQYFNSIKETDIEHIVATSEAHDSGMCGRSKEEKRRFASDPHNLTLAAPSLNRYEKKDKDAGEWLPSLNQCWFARKVVWIKQTYGLTVDFEEKQQLQKTLRNCSRDDLAMKIVRANSQQTWIPESNASSIEKLALEQWDDNGNGRITCKEARDHRITPVHRGQPAYPYMDDRDGDGIVCE